MKWIDEPMPGSSKPVPTAHSGPWCAQIDDPVLVNGEKRYSFWIHGPRGSALVTTGALSSTTDVRGSNYDRWNDGRTHADGRERWEWMVDDY